MPKQRSGSVAPSARAVRSRRSLPAAQSPQVAALLAAKLNEARRAAAADNQSAAAAYEQRLVDERHRAAALAKRVQARDPS